MAAKGAKGPAASKTTSGQYRIVSRRIASVFTPKMSMARKLLARQAIQAKANQRQALALQRKLTRTYQYQNTYFRKQQLRYVNDMQRLSAMRSTQRQTLQMSRGARARRLESKRVFRNAGIASYARGYLIGLENGKPSAMMNVLTQQQSVARNTSGAARAAQAAKARKGNATRKGTKRGAATVTSSTIQSTSRVQTRRTPSISRSRALRGKHPTAAALKPKAGIVLRDVTGETPWITAGNDQGVGNCAAVAIANHLLYHEMLEMTDDQVNLLAEQGETIPELIEALKAGLFENVGVFMYGRGWPGPGNIQVYKTGPKPGDVHAGLRLPYYRKIVSWGQETYLSYPVAEAWFIKWAISWPSSRRSQLS